jgi:hypothetical protein
VYRKYKYVWLYIILKSLNSMAGAVLQLSETGTLVEGMEDSALDQLAHPGRFGI